MFASAEINRAGFVGSVFDGGHSAILVTPVAEGLPTAFAAGAPVIVFAGLHFHSVGSFLGNAGLVHGVFLDNSGFDFNIDWLEAGAAVLARGLEGNADAASCGDGLGKFHFK